MLLIGYMSHTVSGHRIPVANKEIRAELLKGFLNEMYHSGTSMCNWDCGCV